MDQTFGVFDISIFDLPSEAGLRDNAMRVILVSACIKQYLLLPISKNFTELFMYKINA